MPKEAHIDSRLDWPAYNQEVLNYCIGILNKKLESIKKIFPAHLKNKDFDIIIHGEYLVGYDWKQELPHKWSGGEPVFNIKQLGVPEEHQPLIKTS